MAGPEDTFDRHFSKAGLILEHPRIGSIWISVCGVQDLPRHLGQHSGGMVICQGQLDSVVPLEPATMPGRVVVQWDKEDCADLGIIKVDLLGLGMMAVMKDSIGLIRDHYGEEVDLAHLPADDLTFMTRSAKGGHDWHVSGGEPRANVFIAAQYPEKFYDMVVQVAIIRSGTDRRGR